MASQKVDNVYIKDFFSLAGPVEKKGLIKDYDLTMDDYYYYSKTFEQAEIKMQNVVVNNLLFRNNLKDDDISYLIGGDLTNQIATSSYNASKYAIPFIGLYAACTTFPLELIIASLFHKDNIICLTSSHNLVAEKQFRYPIEYGSYRVKPTTFTATGSVGCLLTNKKTNIKIESYTIGKVIDMGITDSTNMGAVMAPAAARTISEHLEEMKRTIDYYDLVLTGDLGCLGSKILQRHLKETYNKSIPKHLDAGCELYLKSQEDTFSGASGPVALPLYFFNKIVKQGKYQKILLVGTGSLHNSFLVNQKLPIPAISHAVSIEVGK